MENLEPLCNVGGDIKWASSLEISVIVPGKIKNRVTTASSNSTSGCRLQRIESRNSDICTPLFLTALFTTAKRWKQHKYPLMDEQINNTVYYELTMLYCAALQRKEVMTCVTAWISEPWNRCAKWGKPVIYKHCGIPLMEGIESQIQGRRKQKGCGYSKRRVECQVTAWWVLTFSCLRLPEIRYRIMWPNTPELYT